MQPHQSIARALHLAICGQTGSIKHLYFPLSKPWGCLWVSWDICLHFWWCVSWESKGTESFEKEGIGSGVHRCQGCIHMKYFANSKSTIKIQYYVIETDLIMCLVLCGHILAKPIMKWQSWLISLHWKASQWKHSPGKPGCSKWDLVYA